MTSEHGHPRDGTEYSLEELASRVGGRVHNPPNSDLRLSAVVSMGKHDSPGSVFVACKGESADGHAFVDQAFARGSVAAVVTQVSALQGRPGIEVDDSRRALSSLAAAFAGDPSKDLLTIGVTGTNGKTTVHWMLYHGLNRLRKPAIRIGSLGIRAESGRVDRSGKTELRGGGRILMTTPGPEEIHESMRLALALGIEACVLETSSHALDQCRVKDVWYDAGIFTNLSPDHLDYHRDMEDYFRSKVSLFEQLAAPSDASRPSRKIAVINQDCSHGQRLIRIATDLGLQVSTFGEDQEASTRVVEFRQGLSGGTLVLQSRGDRFKIFTNLIGDFNASNLAAAFDTLVSLGFSPPAVAGALTDIPQIPGRLESIGTGDVGVFVDYAHTGEGLHKLLSAVRGFVDRDLWVVFGCGGAKDPGKRRAMGTAAAALADRIVLTSDNPRDEDPAEIVNDILASGCRPDFIELDRALAIRRTLSNARKGDVVVLAGKGHEDYQIIAGKTLPFSDREEALRALEADNLEL